MLRTVALLSLILLAAPVHAADVTTPVSLTVQRLIFARGAFVVRFTPAVNDRQGCTKSNQGSANIVYGRTGDVLATIMTEVLKFDWKVGFTFSGCSGRLPNIRLIHLERP